MKSLPWCSLVAAALLSGQVAGAAPAPAVASHAGPATANVKVESFSDRVEVYVEAKQAIGAPALRWAESPHRLEMVVPGLAAGSTRRFPVDKGIVQRVDVGTSGGLQIEVLTLSNPRCKYAYGNAKHTLVFTISTNDIVKGNELPGGPTGAAASAYPPHVRPRTVATRPVHVSPPVAVPTHSSARPVAPPPAVTPPPRVAPQPTVTPPPRVAPQPTVAPPPRVAPQPTVAPSPRVSPPPAVAPRIVHSRPTARLNVRRAPMPPQHGPEREVGVVTTPPSRTQPPMRPSEPPPVPVSPVNSSATASRHVSLTYTNGDLAGALKALARAAGLQADIDPRVQGSVTASFTDVPLNQAVTTILGHQTTFYEYQITDTALRVFVSGGAAGNTIPAPASVTRAAASDYFPIRDKKASEVLEAVRRAVPALTYSVDERLNVIEAEGEPADLDRLRKLLQKISVK